jgi:hypothetical protein
MDGIDCCPDFSSPLASLTAFEQAGKTICDSIADAFVSCLKSVGVVVVAPIYNSLQSDLSKTELIKEFINKNNLSETLLPIYDTNKTIADIPNTFYKSKTICSWTDVAEQWLENF